MLILNHKRCTTSSSDKMCKCYGKFQIRTIKYSHETVVRRRVILHPVDGVISLTVELFCSVLQTERKQHFIVNIMPACGELILNCYNSLNTIFIKSPFSLLSYQMLYISKDCYPEIRPRECWFFTNPAGTNKKILHESTLKDTHVVSRTVFQNFQKRTIYRLPVHCLRPCDAESWSDTNLERRREVVLIACRVLEC